MQGSIDVTWPARYRLFLPEGPIPSAGYPLVVALHGARDHLDGFEETLAPWNSAPFARLLLDGPFPIEVRTDEERRLGRMWYQYTGNKEQFDAALHFAAEHVRRVIRAATADQPIDSERHALFGYSMGGYVAGFLGLDQPQAWRGLVQFGSRLKTESFAGRLSAARGLPITMLHGERDRLVTLEGQERALAALREAGVAATLERTPGGHRLSEEVVRRAGEVLAGHLAR